MSGHDWIAEGHWDFALAVALFALAWVASWVLQGTITARLRRRGRVGTGCVIPEKSL